MFVFLVCLCVDPFSKANKLMEHLHKSCQYFKGNCQLEESKVESEKKEMFHLKEVRHRFLLETKYLKIGPEGVATFTWRGNVFLLTFSSPSFSTFSVPSFTFNLLLLGSKEQSKGWIVRLEVLGSGGRGSVRRSTTFEGPPGSINQVVDRRRRRMKREVAGVTVGQEMIFKAGGGKVFFDLDLAFKRLGGDI